jgi:hypothetical protein
LRYPRHLGCDRLEDPDKVREFIPSEVEGLGKADVLPFISDTFEKFAVSLRFCTSGGLGTGGGGSQLTARVILGFEAMRANLDDGAARPTDIGIRL